MEEIKRSTKESYLSWCWEFATRVLVSSLSLCLFFVLCLTQLQGCHLFYQKTNKMLILSGIIYFVSHVFTQ